MYSCYIKAVLCNITYMHLEKYGSVIKKLYWKNLIKSYLNGNIYKQYATKALFSVSKWIMEVSMEELNKNDFVKIFLFSWRD